MKKVCFNGCSFTVGEGFATDQRDRYIYDRLVCNALGWQRTNVAEGGSSNLEIFRRSAMHMEHDFDIVFVQWTALHRLWFNPGPDCKLVLNDGRDEFCYRDIRLDKKTKIKLQENLLILNHDYHNIFRLVDFCSILDRLADHHGTTVIYINGLLPWTADLCNPAKANNLSQSLSDYTKQMLDFDHRDDHEIYKFWVDLQNRFAKLDQSRWVNLFDSFHSCSVDLGPEGHHPGPESHKIMADKIMRYLELHGIV